MKLQTIIVESSFKAKVVMITGASSGIGRGLALELARRGAKVGLIARRADLLAELVDEVAAVGAKALALPGDVQDSTAMKLAAEKIAAELGPIDILIANAGVGASRHAAEIDAAETARVMNINVIGVANCVAAVVPSMVARRSGQLVAISSLAAYRGLPKSAAYCGSKAAVSAFFESLRLDLASLGIAVTIIHPGFIKTPLTSGRNAKMPFFLELDDAVNRMANAIEKRKKRFSFPWQLATIVRLGLIMPMKLYDQISRGNSFRE